MYFNNYYEEQEYRTQMLGGLYNLITEEESYSFREVCDGAGYDDMPEIFREFGLRWNHLVQTDVEAIFNLQHPRYFKTAFRWVEDYRRAHGIRFNERVHRLESWDHGIQSAKDYMTQISREHEQYGICLWMDEMGYACHVEQAYFYRTQEWKDRAAAARYEWDYRCCRCKASDKPLHVHHGSPIVTAYSPNFDNNFASYRLSVLCNDCHKRTHGMTVRSGANYGFNGATTEEVQEEKEYLRKRRAAHDKRRVCLFCRNRGLFK